MTFNAFNRPLIVLYYLLLFFSCLCAQEKTGYYRAAEGKNKAGLKNTLYKIINSHTAIEYYSLSASFKKTDWHPAVTNYPEGYFWDMYSNEKRTTWSGMNREHSMPKSWFGISSGEENSAPIGSDLHNLFPSNSTANEKKSNFPLGEVGSISFNNGTVKVGSNNFPGYNGNVFEPGDEYKGDFARTYMYMVTCYEDYASVWRSLGTASMLYNNTYPTLNPYAINLLLKWSNNDPVSEKERIRNNAVDSYQNNRNPFIDHSELADFIWGSRISEFWSLKVGPPENDLSLEIVYIKSSEEISLNLNNPELARFSIYNMQGVALKTDYFSPTGTTSVSELQNGLYIIKVYSGTKRKVGKFLVIR